MGSTIGQIVELTDRQFIGALAEALGNVRINVKFAINEDGLRVKIDEGSWSPPRGTLQEGS